ncbi:cation channel sperm-associated targeting subunit tau-like [Diadema antillarum]|uniref:cation channel sperm-associated targeting subunit tau-like n=1 Tax=Diadema antillarum TaxID=105358 RepID=UPI003A857028
MSKHSQVSVETDEDGYNPSSAHYVTAPPSGVLSFHCKRVKNLDESHAVVTNPEFYIRFRVGKLSKCTKTFCWTMGTKFAIVNDIKHFSLMISRIRTDPSNEVRIDLVMVETAHVHRIIGHREMHLYDIIRNMYLAGTYELKYRQNSVAFLDFEICFAYGIFGYGYSHQLQNRQRRTADIVSHSFLYRSEPPANRRQVDSIAMAPVPMELPDFLSLREQVEIGSPAVREKLAERYDRQVLDVFADVDKQEPVILARTMKRRLQTILSDFGLLTSRQQRKQFLERLILRQVDESSNQHADQGKDGAQSKPAQSELVDMDQVAAPELQAYGDDDDHASVSDVTELSNFLANAPGIQARGRYERRRPSMSVLHEDESVDDFSDEPSTSLQPGSDASSLASEQKAALEERRRSTLAELPGKFMMSFANKLRLWKVKGGPATTPLTPSRPESVTIVDGPASDRTSRESTQSRNFYRSVKLLKKASHQKEPPVLPDN